MTFKFTVAVGFTVVLATGCPAGDGRGTTSNTQGSSLSTNRPNQTIELDHLVFHDSCVSTKADECNDCQGRQRAKENDCWNTCSDAAYYGGPVADCVSLCGDIGNNDLCSGYCDAEPDECVARSYRFELSGPVDTDVQEQCFAAVERDDECGERTVGTACDVYAQVERKAAVKAYECVAQSACGQDATACFENLGTSQLSQMVSSWCESEPLGEELPPILDIQGTWLRGEVLADLEICQPLCGSGDFAKCVLAWSTATVGG